jgi:biotin-dependent carboxylase-like uncharacterized protein
MIEVLEPGPLTTVQDRGRPGYAALGVARAGAFALQAFQVANRLVGNSRDAAALELTFGGLVLRVVDAATVALTGAPCPGLDPGVPVSLPAGTVLRLGSPPIGVRSYLAVRGGIDVPALLGSRSTDLLSGIGPDPLRTGDRLTIGPQPQESVLGSPAPLPTIGNSPVLHMRLGPRDDWFAPSAVALLTTAAWVVRADSNRIGVRLDGPALPRSRAGELPSEPTLPGAVQVPSDGRPIVFGPDAPTSGGYPVIGVVRRGDLEALAQARPGGELRFRVSRTADAGRTRTAPPRQQPRES